MPGRIVRLVDLMGDQTVAPGRQEGSGQDVKVTPDGPIRRYICPSCEATRWERQACASN